MQQDAFCARPEISTTVIPRCVHTEKKSSKRHSGIKKRHKRIRPFLRCSWARQCNKYGKPFIAAETQVNAEIQR